MYALSQTYLRHLTQSSGTNCIHIIFIIMKNFNRRNSHGHHQNYVQEIHLSIDLSVPWPRGRGTTNDLATSCLHLCLSSTALCDGKVQSCPLSDVFPPLPLSSSCSPHSALQDGLFFAGWLGDMSLTLQLSSLHCSQEIFMMPDGMLDSIADFSYSKSKNWADAK